MAIITPINYARFIHGILSVWLPIILQNALMVLMIYVIYHRIYVQLFQIGNFNVDYDVN